MNKEHITHQSSNDWVTCSCGKLFSDSKKGNMSKWDKLERHKELMKFKDSLKNGGRRDG